MHGIPIEIPDTLWMYGYLEDYENPKAKISHLVRSGDLIRLKRGVYLNEDSADDPYILGKAANRLYGPSYVSFIYALRWYGLIPEHVRTITSATFRKGRTKRYDTPVGSFLYRDVPESAYPWGIVFAEGREKRFLIAGPEKALCDQLYTLAGVRSITRIESLLFEDLRVDREQFEALDRERMREYAAKYHTVTLHNFGRYLARGGYG
jgi:hypothetical protein